MKKEEVIMQYLQEKVFDPNFNVKTCSAQSKSGMNLTIARMRRLSAEKMVQYFWSALVTENALVFSKHMKEEGLICFEDVREEFKARFNEQWLQS